MPNWGSCKCFRKRCLSSGLTKKINLRLGCTSVFPAGCMITEIKQYHHHYLCIVFVRLPTTTMHRSNNAIISRHATHGTNIPGDTEYLLQVYSHHVTPAEQSAHLRNVPSKPSTPTLIQLTVTVIRLQWFTHLLVRNRSLSSVEFWHAFFFLLLGYGISQAYTRISFPWTLSR